MEGKQAGIFEVSLTLYREGTSAVFIMVPHLYFIEEHDWKNLKRAMGNYKKKYVKKKLV